MNTMRTTEFITFTPSSTEEHIRYIGLVVLQSTVRLNELCKSINSKKRDCKIDSDYADFLFSELDYISEKIGNLKCDLNHIDNQLEQYKRLYKHYEELYEQKMK